MKKKQPTNFKQSTINALEAAGRYRVVAFVIVIACIYGFMVHSINSLSSIQPGESSISKEVTAIRIPKIDQSVVKQLEALRDNSVNVQALFNEARNNPFNE